MAASWCSWASGAVDGSAEAEALANKVANLRIVGDDDGKANLSLLETGGTALW